MLDLLTEWEGKISFLASKICGRHRSDFSSDFRSGHGVGKSSMSLKSYTPGALWLNLQFENCFKKIENFQIFFENWKISVLIVFEEIFKLQIEPQGVTDVRF